MDGLIPLFLKALKKKKATKHRRFVSSSSSSVDVVAELPPKGPSSLFMTPQHPRAAPRWHDGEEGDDLFMTPQHPRASRWLDDGDGSRGGGEPAAAPSFVAVVPLSRERGRQGHKPQRLTVMEAPLLKR